MKYHPTIIAGGGWAGLAAAVELSQRNIPVTVFESAKQLGGRARSLPTENTLLDNGQHLMIGAYSQMQSLLNTIGVNTREAFLQIPQQLEMLDLNSREKVFELKLPRLPTPLHLLVGMLQCPSLSFKQKLQTLLRFNRLLNQELEQDMSVDDWLNSAGLPEAYTEYLLKPLCLAALTTHTHEASARAFQTVLQQTFNGPASNTDLLIPATDLGNIFPAAAKHYIESKGGQVLTEHRVSQLNLAQNKIESITVNDQRVEIEQLILATPPPVTQKLLTGIPACDDITQQLSRLDYEPVTTVYLQYPSQTRLPVPMMGLLNSTGEWLFDRAHCQQPGLIAVVISAGGSHMALEQDQLATTIAGELASLFPDWPAADHVQVIREKRATLRCVVNIDRDRPGIQTAIPNLRLCGDYVYIEDNQQPGLPSTLEGAMRSGVKCALQLIQDKH